MSKKTGTRLHASDRRNQLIEATITCLMEEGAEGLSSRKICAKAGVSLGLLNHHFASQIELVAATYECVSERYCEALKLRLEAGTSNQQQPIKTLVACAFEEDLMSPKQLRAWVVFWSKTIDSPVMRAAHDAINERLHALLIDVLTRSLANQSEQQLSVLALEYSALLDGLWLDWSLNGSNQTPDYWQAILNQWLARTLSMA